MLAWTQWLSLRRGYPQDDAGRLAQTHSGGGVDTEAVASESYVRYCMLQVRVWSGNIELHLYIHYCSFLTFCGCFFSFFWQCGSICPLRLCHRVKTGHVGQTDGSSPSLALHACECVCVYTSVSKIDGHSCQVHTSYSLYAVSFLTWKRLSAPWLRLFLFGAAPGWDSLLPHTPTHNIEESFQFCAMNHQRESKQRMCQRGSVTCVLTGWNMWQTKTEFDSFIFDLLNFRNCIQKLNLYFLISIIAVEKLKLNVTIWNRIV